MNGMTLISSTNANMNIYTLPSVVPYERKEKQGASSTGTSVELISTNEPPVPTDVS